jgi:hypothetical protein
MFYAVQPLKENVNAWCALCFGRLGVVHFTQSSDEEISSAGVTRFLSSEGGTPPLLSIVSRLDQVTEKLI